VASTNPIARKEAARQREAAELDAEILDAIGRGWDDPLSDDEFDRLARAIFAHQHRFLPAYRQLCQLHGVSAPADVQSWSAIPPVPTGAFKVGRWAAFPEEAETVTFRTSGTTVGSTGVHRFETLGLVNAAIVPAARRFLLPDRESIRFLFLSPAPGAAPDSSLVHMFAVFREALGAPGSRFLLPGGARGAVPADEVGAALDAARRAGEPVLVAGPAIAFQRMLEALGGESWALPAGSRAMVTGGFKGRRDAAEPEALADAVTARLGVPASHQVQEYGMTELSSQYYDERLRRELGLSVEPSEDGERERSATFVEPPWARARVVDPRTGRDLPPGQIGALVHVDLANRGSAVAIQTSDLGVRRGRRVFALRGREGGAEARGCSLAVDLWLGG
jgi:acyl-CoA synthetase (AMP-forming)/AMP-acid ligase II